MPKFEWYDGDAEERTIDNFYNIGNIYIFKYATSTAVLHINRLWLNPENHRGHVPETYDFYPQPVPFLLVWFYG